MPYVTSVERIGIQKGILQKAREDVLDVLETRFEEGPQTVVEAVNALDDPSVLKVLHKKAITVGSLEEFERVIGEDA